MEAEDEQAVSTFTEAQTREHAALVEWVTARETGRGRLTSEAAVVRALLRAGVEALRERALEAGYADLVASRTEDEAGQTRAARDRYVDRTERVARG